VTTFLDYVAGKFQRRDAIAVGSGAASAGKVPELNASGYIDPTMLPLRRAGFLEVYIGVPPGVGWFTEYDGNWVVVTLDSVRTIGNPSSGANIAETWTQALFTLLWQTYSIVDAPLITSTGMGVSKGVSASEDWGLNRKITFPDFRGRGIIGAGSGSGLTARTKNQSVGAQTATLSTSNMPAHTHNMDGIGSNALLRTPNNSGYFTATTGAGSADTTVSATASTGSGGAFSIMPPSKVEHLIISAGAR
jgi:hypothetical protein